MKMTIKVEGCPFEDAQTLKVFSNSMEMYSAICEAKRHIRDRIKYDPSISDDELKFLEGLAEELNIDGLFD